MKKRVLFGLLAMFIALSFIGCTDDDEKDEGKVLKVTGLQASPIIFGAALISEQEIEENGDDASPSATGMNNPTGTFVLYEPTSDFMPDGTKPWKGKGNHTVALSTAPNANGDQYLYTAGKPFIELNTAAITAAITAALQDQSSTFNPQTDSQDQQKISQFISGVITDLGQNALIINIVPHNFTETTTTLAWNQFKKRPSSSEIQAFFTSQESQSILAEILTGILTNMQP